MFSKAQCLVMESLEWREAWVKASLFRSCQYLKQRQVPSFIAVSDELKMLWLDSGFEQMSETQE